LSAAGLARREARFGPPRRISGFLKIGIGGKPGHCLRGKIGKAQHHGLDAGAGGVSGLEPPRRPPQPPVQAQDRSVTLGPIGRLQDVADFGGRTHFAAGHAIGVPAHARQVYAAEGHAAVVAREARSASRRKLIRAR
jgi:hypothetical protein